MCTWVQADFRDNSNVDWKGFNNRAQKIAASLPRLKLAHTQVWKQLNRSSRRSDSGSAEFEPEIVIGTGTAANDVQFE